jgi:hypothetical protein
MLRTAKSIRLADLLVGAIVAAAVTIPAAGQNQDNQNDDNSRSVRIIDGPAVPPAPPMAQPPATPALPQPAPFEVAPAPTPPAAPLATPIIGDERPASAILQPSAAAPARPLTPEPGAVIAAPPPAPATLTPAPASPPASHAALPPTPTDIAPRLSPAELQALSKSIKVANPAELSIEILPGLDIVVDSQVSFRIFTKKPGYLILVDVDPTGKLTQIYPNPLSLLSAGTVRATSNFVRPGKPLQIPNQNASLAGFEFVAKPPLGTAMVVAILSDLPVQIIDLPDLPTGLAGQTSAVDHLAKLANDLRIPKERDGRLQVARWSFDAKFYSIR